MNIELSYNAGPGRSVLIDLFETETNFPDVPNGERPAHVLQVCLRQGEEHIVCTDMFTDQATPMCDVSKDRNASDLGPLFRAVARAQNEHPELTEVFDLWQREVETHSRVRFGWSVSPLESVTPQRRPRRSRRGGAGRRSAESADPLHGYLEFLRSLNDDALAGVLDMRSQTYHSVQHARIVSQIVSDLGGDDVTALAGLFHDAGHSCSADVADHANLARAIRCFDRECSGFGPMRTLRVTELIIATHSGVTNLTHYTEDARLLYDADTLAGYELGQRDIVSEDQIVAGLKAEGYPGGSSLDFIAMRGLHSRAAQERYGHLIENA